jgi:hypothetical protein
MVVYVLIVRCASALVVCVCWRSRCGSIDVAKMAGAARFVEYLRHTASLFEQCRSARDETLADWVLRNMNSADRESIQCFGLPAIWYSGLYPPAIGDFDYQHCHIPRHEALRLPRHRTLTTEELYCIQGMRLDPGWEHYEIWERERRILLLRRRREKAHALQHRPVVPDCAVRGGETPRPPEEDIADEVDDRVLDERRGVSLAIEGERQPIAYGGADRGGETPLPPGADVSADEFVDSKVADECLGTPPAFEDTNTGQTADIESLDEKFAKAGLSVKLFAEQTPELMALVDGVEQILQKVTSVTTSAHERVVAVSRAFVVLRCIRGAAGIAWATSRIVADGSGHIMDLLQVTQSAASLARVAGQLAQELPETGRNWAAHREGRHVAKSGILALQALAASAQKASEAALMLQVVIDYILHYPRANGEVPTLSEGCVLLALVATQGRLPVSLDSRCGSENKTGVAHAAGYNAVNAGLGLLCWGWKTGRCHISCFSEVVLEYICASQAQHAQQHWRNMQINDPDHFEAKFRVLAAHATRLIPESGVGHMSMPSTVLFPGSLFVHVCEWGQLLKTVEEHTIGQVLNRSKKSIQSVARAALQRLIANETSSEGKSRTTCFTQEVFNAVLAARHRIVNKRPDNAYIVARKERPLASAEPQPRKKTAKKRKRHLGKFKDTIMCEYCKSLVRRDVISRHRKTSKCLLAQTSHA